MLKKKKKNSNKAPGLGEKGRGKNYQNPKAWRRCPKELDFRRLEGGDGRWGRTACWWANHWIQLLPWERTASAE